MFTRHSLLSILDLGPIDACIQLSTQLPRMTVQELHVELPYVIRRAFGFGRFDWSLRDIGSDRAHLYTIIQEFLSPWHGQLWKALLRLQDHSPQLTFQFSVSDLPLHLRAKLASLSLPDIVRGRTTTTGQHLTSLSLDPIEYFLFHLLSYIISDQHPLDRSIRCDSVYLTILEMYLCLFLPIDADEFRVLLMPAGSSGTSTVSTTSHIIDPRLSPPAPVDTTPKKSNISQSYLFGSNTKQRGNGGINTTTSPTSPPASSLVSSPPQVLLSTNMADTNELMKKIDYFIKCYVAFLIDVFQTSKSVFGTASGSILVQEFNLSDIHLLCIRMFIKRLHLFCSYQIGIGNQNISLSSTGLTPLEQRNLLVPLQTLKRTCIDSYVRQPLYTLLQIGIVRCTLDQRYNTLLYIWYTYIRPWRFSPQAVSADQTVSNLLDTTTIEQDTQQSIISPETLSFVERNILFYGRLFQLAIDRLQKTDLTNSLIAQLINKLANVFSSKNFSALLLKAEQFVAHSSGGPHSPTKRRPSPPSSPNRPPPAYSLLCDETRTLMLGCLRKITSVIHTNARRIEERERLAEQQRQQASQPTQIVSTNAREMFQRLLFKLPFLKPSSPVTANLQLLTTPLVPTDIIEQLTNVKNKFTELFQIDPNVFDTTINNDEPSLTTSPSVSLQQNNKSLSTSVTGSPSRSSYSPYQLENPILSPANPFELRPLLWFNRHLSENINIRYATQINGLYNRQGPIGLFFRQLFYGPNDQRVHSIRTPQINFRHFADVRTLLLLVFVHIGMRLIVRNSNLPLNIVLLTLVIFIWNVFRAVQNYRQSSISLQ